MHTKKLGRVEAGKKKKTETIVLKHETESQEVSQSRAYLKIHFDSTPTSVCTIDIRYDRISDTSPKMSTNS